ncbi:MAG: outer membrane protein assembly factor BamA [Acidobacteriota bacterium]
MQLRTWLLAVSVLGGALAAGAQEALKATVEEVQVVGGTTVSTDTVEYYLGISAGDEWSPESVKKNFHRFWDSGLVEDLKVEVEELGPGRVRVVVTVKERPKVSEFSFSGNKKMSNTSIREKLDTAGVTLKRNVPLKSSDLQRFKRAIEEEYAKEGYLSAIVNPVAEDVGPNLKKVTFNIDEGGKVRIGEITFEGNEVFSDRRLRRALKKLKERSLTYWFGKKLIWSKESWGEDAENLKKHYMNRGYKDILVGEPKVDLVARNPEGETQKDKKFRTHISIPVQEGGEFALGELKIAGASVFEAERLRKLYEEVKSGRRYKYSKIEAGNEAVRALYNSRGYIYAYTNQVLTDTPDKEGVTDVTINIYEGDRYKLGRLEFSGNTKTQEKVLRREFRLVEGEWMDMNLFRRSVFKVNQLGYFKLTEDPVEFKFDEANRLVNVTVKGQEVGRTDIQFGAGYSEIEHLFLQFMFNTRNFLGRGETLGAAVTSGRLADSYSISFSEPYFLDRRMVIGGSVYKSNYDLTESFSSPYERESKGGSIVWGVGVGMFGQFSTAYGYEDVFQRYSVSRYGAAGDPPTNPHRRPFDPPYKNMPDPELYYAVYRGVTSSFTPAFVLDSRDDPFDPNEGATLFARVRYAGGILGGDFYYIRPEIGFSYFHPLTRRYILAANFEAGMIDPFSDKTIPIYDRYRLGGERSLRGFEYYGVLPRTAEGSYFIDTFGVRIGGDRFLQLNLEYQIKLGGPIKLILFTDIGNTWHESQGWDFSLLRQSAGAELRIFLPIFQAPLRFIYGVNLDPFDDEKGSDFQFSIGTTF